MSIKNKYVCTKPFCKLFKTLFLVQQYSILSQSLDNTWHCMITSLFKFWFLKFIFSAIKFYRITCEYWKRCPIFNSCVWSMNLNRRINYAKNVNEDICNSKLIFNFSSFQNGMCHVRSIQTSYMKLSISSNIDIPCKQILT